MVLRGHVHNGAICLDEPVVLPEGASVRVEFLEGVAATSAPPVADQGSIEQQLAAIWQDLPPSEWAKLPADLSENLDHYIYGTSRS